MNRPPHFELNQKFLGKKQKALISFGRGKSEVTTYLKTCPHLAGPAPLPVVPREPSPPPKPDGSECHRSQSAIFTRLWNRGEGNSCSRTDMIFKPVPDSKLARKREERLRKAAEREEAAKADAVKRAHQEFAGW